MTASTDPDYRLAVEHMVRQGVGVGQDVCQRRYPQGQQCCLPRVAHPVSWGEPSPTGVTHPFIASADQGECGEWVPRGEGHEDEDEWLPDEHQWAQTDGSWSCTRCRRPWGRGYVEYDPDLDGPRAPAADQGEDGGLTEAAHRVLAGHSAGENIYIPSTQCARCNDSWPCAPVVLARTLLADRGARRDEVGPTPRLCSQCGERLASMVKIGTTDGWCTACLDEAAEGEAAPEVRDYGHPVSDQNRDDVAAWLIREADQRAKFFPQRVDGVDALMRSLARDIQERRA